MGHRDELSGRFETPLDADSMEVVWQGVGPRVVARRRRRAALYAVGTAALVALVVIFGRRWMTSPSFLAHAPLAHTPLALHDGQPLERGAWDGAGARVVDLADGSRIEISEDGVAAVVESAADRVRLRQSRGRFRYSVTPGGPRKWSIETPRALVEVVGTVFVVDVEVERVRVSVERGQVSVGGRALGASETLEIGSPRHVGGAVSVDALPVIPVPVRSAARPSPEPPPADAVGDLLERADGARAEGRPADAVTALEEVVSNHPRDARAPTAAFTLGRVELDALGHPARAAAAFARAVDLGIGEPLREDAFVRRVEAFARANDEGARDRAAQAYRAQYPGKDARIARWVTGP